MDDTWVPEAAGAVSDTSGDVSLAARAADGDGGAVPPGTVLGPYRLIEILGSGGMGHVWRAEHLRLGRQVALKMLRRRCAEDPSSVARFFAEARAVSSLKHENIVDVTDFLELPEGSCFVMELLRGKSLGAAMRLERFSLERITNIAAQVAAAMEAVHAASIVHRDLKPDNIFLVDDNGRERVKLLDFGVAKLAAKERALETRAGALLGTPAYMAPEQLVGESVDARADIYALGVVLYELASGVRPFMGESLGALAIQHSIQKAPPLPLSTDRRLAALVMRCLAKSPAHRPQAMADVSAALAAIARSPEPQPVLVAPDDGGGARAPTRRLRFVAARGVAVAAAVAVVAIVAVIAVAALRAPAREAPAAPPSIVAAGLASSTKAGAAPAPAPAPPPAEAPAPPAVQAVQAPPEAPAAVRAPAVKAARAEKKRATSGAATDVAGRATILDPFADP